MGQANVEIFPGVEDLSRAAAARFAEFARERVQQGKEFTVALSGGEMGRALLEALANPEFSQRIQWDRVQLFQVDERCVPPDDIQSNYRMIRETLLRPVPGAGHNFHRMMAESDGRDVASAEYAAQIRNVLAQPEGALPRFDLVFMGLGPDGHTASLFPGSSALDETRRWVCPNYVEKLHMYRMTLTYPVLNAASEIVFLVSGAGKAEILRKVLEGPRHPKQFPAQGIQPGEGSLNWYLDHAAAQLLRKAQVQRKIS